jgi:hypothetical protein
MNIQSIQKMTVAIVLGILTALCKQIYIGLALYGCGLAGIPLTFDEISEL